MFEGRYSNRNREPEIQLAAKKPAPVEEPPAALPEKLKVGKYPASPDYVLTSDSPVRNGCHVAAICDGTEEFNKALAYRLRDAYNQHEDNARAIFAARIALVAVSRVQEMTEAESTEQWWELAERYFPHITASFPPPTPEALDEWFGPQTEENKHPETVAEQRQEMYGEEAGEDIWKHVLNLRTAALKLLAEETVS